MDDFLAVRNSFAARVMKDYLFGATCPPRVRVVALAPRNSGDGSWCESSRPEDLEAIV